MKIELIKKIDVFKIIFIGEIEFFNDSPYNDLFKDFNTKEELEGYLNEKLPKKAVENIIGKLEKLGVIKNNDIVYKDIFPNKEYGKYELLIYENDEKLPFKYKNKKISRLKPTSENTHSKIVCDKDFIFQVKDKTNKEFVVKFIEKHKAIKEFNGKEDLKIIYDGEWKYSINEKIYETQDIDFNLIFDNWDINTNRIKVKFEETDETDKKNFYTSFIIEKKEIENYGIFKIKAENIPIIPADEKEAFKWVMFFLAKEIQELDRYIDKTELEHLFYDIIDRYEILKLFKLRFDIDMILKTLRKNKKLYFLVKTPLDVYPFEKNFAKERIIIQHLDDFKEFCKIKNLIIVDRYVNTLRHFKILREILNKLENPKTFIITQKPFKDKEKKDIDKIIEELGVKIIIKEKKDIPHQRWWIVDNKFYETGNSLDGIHKTSFNLYEKEEAFNISKGLQDIVEELKCEK